MLESLVQIPKPSTLRPAYMSASARNRSWGDHPVHHQLEGLLESTGHLGSGGSAAKGLGFRV